MESASDSDALRYGLAGRCERNHCLAEGQDVVDEIALRLAALGKMVMGAFFLYLCSQLFHAPKDLKRAAKTPFHHVIARVAAALMGLLALGAVMVIWTGV